MIKIARLCQILLVLLCLNSNNVFSQSPSVWEPIYLTASGHNRVQGIEGLFRAEICSNGERVVFIKFINHNSQDIKLEWYHGVFTQELKWVNKEGESDKKTVMINGNKEAQGACSSTAPFQELIIKLSDFIDDPNNFKRYSAINLEITVIKN